VGGRHCGHEALPGCRRESRNRRLCAVLAGGQLVPEEGPALGLRRLVAREAADAGGVMIHAVDGQGRAGDGLVTRRARLARQALEVPRAVGPPVQHREAAGQRGVAGGAFEA
jgi:hypothetical protein